MNFELNNLYLKCVKLKKFLQDSYCPENNFECSSSKDFSNITIDIVNNEYFLHSWFEHPHSGSVYDNTKENLTESKALEILCNVEKSLKNRAIEKVKKDMEYERREKENRELERKLDTILSRIA